MNVHEFIYYDIKFDLNNSCIPTKEKIIGMIDKKKMMHFTMNLLKKLMMYKLIMWWQIEQNLRLLKVHQ